MNEEIPSPTLSDLRAEYGKPLPVKREWKQIRPGVSRMTYGNENAWWYRSPVLRLEDQLRPVEEIAEFVDQNRSLVELASEFTSAFDQIRARAHCGEQHAIELVVSVARKVVSSLQWLAEGQPEKVQTEAADSSHWPVMLSLNPQDIADAKKKLRRLGVGTAALIPTRPSQRVNFNNPWTQTIMRALKICWNNKKTVPLWESHAVGAREERIQRKLTLGQEDRRGIEIWASRYWLPTREVIIIPDWERQCATLTRPITASNYKDWWDVLKICVLECWDECPKDYQSAMKKISDAKAPKEYDKRHRALGQIEKAFKSLVGVRQ